MEKINISSDSVCDLSSELLKANDIRLFPLIVNLGDVSELDAEGIPEKIYAYAEKTKSTPRTSARSVIEYKEFFEQNKPENGFLIHFSLSNELSVSYANASQAAKDLQNVFVIDSRSLSTGVGVLIMQAVKLRNENVSAKEIVEKVTSNTSKVQCSFIVKDLTYLHRGGRCSGTTRLFAIALGIKPQIVMKNGKMIAGKKYMGGYENCVKKYVNDILNNYTNPDLEYCFITHTKMDNTKIVDSIRTQILEKYPFKNIVETTAGGTITSHSGPNTIGILYATK